MYTHNKTKKAILLTIKFKLQINITVMRKKCQIIQFTVATYNTNSPFEVKSKLIHSHDLWHKAEFVQYVHGKQILGNSNGGGVKIKMKSSYLHKMLQIFLFHRNLRMVKHIQKKKMEFYSEYLRNYCKLWFWLIYFKVLHEKANSYL